MAIINTPQEFMSFVEEIKRKKEPEKKVFVCGGTICRARGALEIYNELKRRVKGVDVLLKLTGCQGPCSCGPVVVIEPSGFVFERTGKEDVKDILNALKGAESKGRKKSEIPFIAKQMRLLYNPVIDPTRIEDYIKEGGYSALVKVLKDMKPEEVISEIEKAGLRGRGGGGFPTARKWKACREAHGEPKFVIANGDEGNPGAFMDRSIMEGNPHSVLEGLIIGGYAIGSNQGFVYVRHEYPLAVQHLEKAIEDARKYGFIGNNILGSGFNFDVKIVRGGGAFVCGESTALMASLEGKAGEPRAKHIHTAESGAWGKPSNLNNVETWANVPLIINMGAENYAKIGTKGNTGPKIFSISGDVKVRGIVEVPLGIRLRELIFDICGGIPEGKKFKGALVGGPDGGILPEEKLDLMVDFDTLWEAGTTMGAGGIIVLDDKKCIVDLSLHFMKFTTEESCGKCTPCREGSLNLLRIIQRIAGGKGKKEDIDLIQEISHFMKKFSLCALGRDAPNPVLSALKHYREEFESHLNGVCPAGVCRRR